jgi:hypothetical protein
MMTLTEFVKLRFGGKLAAGKHEPDGAACGLEALSQYQSQPWTDSPQAIGCYDVRRMNDVNVSELVRAECLLPVLEGYQESRRWPIERQKQVTSRLAILTVQRLIPLIDWLPDSIKDQCRYASTLDLARKAARAADAAAAAYAAEATAAATTAAAAAATAAAAYADAAAAAYADAYADADAHAAAYAVAAAAAAAYAAAYAATGAYAAEATAAAAAAAAAAYAAAYADAAAYAVAAAAAYAAAYAAEAAAAYAAEAAAEASERVFRTACQVWLDALTTKEIPCP